MEEYARYIEKREKAREDEFKQKDERMKKFYELNLNTVGKEMNEHERKEMEKRKKYSEKIDREAEMREERERDLSSRRKAETKSMLVQQIQEAKARKGLYKSSINEQADIWRVDTQEFEETIKTKADEKKNKERERLEILKKQMADQYELKKGYSHLGRVRATNSIPTNKVNYQ